MDAEIEETRRQIRRSAALIETAFEGLSTLQNHISEVASTRIQNARSAPLPPFAPFARPSEPTEEPTRSRAMDPGHDVIVLSSPDDGAASSSTAIPASLSPTPTTTTARRRSDPTLDALCEALLQSTQTIRERASELEDLRRSILQYIHERQGLLAEGASPPNTESNAGGTQELVNLGPGITRRLMLDYSLRQRAAGETAATSLGMMVAARASASSPPSSSNTPRDTPNARAPSTAHNSTATTTVTTSSAVETSRSRGSSIPAGIAARVARLAQDIQQDIARITQQSESLMRWISDHRARLDATLSSRLSSMASPPYGTHPSSRRTWTLPSDGEPEPLPPIAPRTAAELRVTPSSSRRPFPIVSDDEFPIPIMRANESNNRPRQQPTEGNSPAQAIPARPRRPSEAARARYLRQSVPNTWSATSPSASSASPREERAPSSSRVARTHDRDSDGPLSLPTRTVMPPSASSSAPAAASSGSVFDDPEFMDAASRVRAAMARSARRYRQWLDRDDDEDTPPSQPHSYRVSRRYNADGDEEEVRVAAGTDPSPGLGDTSSGGGTRERSGDTRIEEDQNEAWMQALSRLEAMSRTTAARSATPQTRWEPPPMTRGGTRPQGLGNPSTLYPESRRSSRGWPRLGMFPSGDELYGEEEGSEYERDIAAMRARARSLIASNAPARTLSGTTTLPPPPPSTRPMSFVPTTQGTPGSLWNDPTVRVRIRAAAVARLPEDLRRVLDATREGGFAPARPSSPSLERPRRARHESTDRDVGLQRPTWGSPRPFCPSVLPLPLVEDVGSLQARSRAFAGAKRLLSETPRKRGASAVIEAGR